MKSKDVHVGLDKKEIRDSLGKKVRKNMYVYDPNGEYSLEERLQVLYKQKAEIEKHIQGQIEGAALYELLKMYGWDYFDVSEEVPFDDDYIGFIGTEEEKKKQIPESKIGE